MRDFYIHSDSLEELLKDFESLDLVFEGEFIKATAEYALDYYGRVVSTQEECDEEGNTIKEATYLPGVYCALRCMSDSFASQVEASSLTLVDKPEGTPAWAN